MRRLFALAAALLAALAPEAAAQEIALTFDDLPAHDPLPPGETHLGVNRALLKALKEAEAPATGFVNGARTQGDPSAAQVLGLWRKAGHPLGNHTWSHRRLTAADAGAFTDELVRNEALLRPLGPGWRWFRYPYLAEGETPAVRAWARQLLARRGYRVASVTLDFSDWAYNAPYARCRAKGDAAAIAALEDRFMAAAAKSLAQSRALSRRLYGREIPLVLLMHAGAFSARMAPRLLDFFESQGLRFVSLDQAQADPFYRPDLEAQASSEPLTLENAARARGLEVPQGPTTAGLDQVCAETP